MTIEDVIRDALHNTPGVECDHVDDKVPTCERDAVHIAAALARSGLLDA